MSGFLLRFLKVASFFVLMALPIGTAAGALALWNNRPLSLAVFIAVSFVAAAIGAAVPIALVSRRVRVSGDVSNKSAFVLEIKEAAQSCRYHLKQEDESGLVFAPPLYGAAERVDVRFEGTRATIDAPILMVGRLEAVLVPGSSTDRHVVVAVVSFVLWFSAIAAVGLVRMVFDFVRSRFTGLPN